MTKHEKTFFESEFVLKSKCVTPMIFAKMIAKKFRAQPEDELPRLRKLIPIRYQRIKLASAVINDKTRKNFF